MISLLERDISIIRRSIDDRTKELSDGVSANIPERLGGRLGPFLVLRGDVERLESKKSACDSAARTLSGVQSILGAIDAIAGNARDVVLGSLGSVNADVGDAMSRAARDVLSRLNSAEGGVFVMGGQDLARTPMPDAVLTNLEREVERRFADEFGFELSDARSASIASDRIAAFVKRCTVELSTNEVWQEFGQRALSGQRIHVPPLSDSVVPVTASDRSIRGVLASLAAAAAVAKGNLSASGRVAGLTSAGSSLSESRSALVERQAEAGALQSRLADQSEYLSRQSAFLDAQSSRLVSVDKTEVAVRLNELTTALEASLSITARLSRLSLLNFLSR